MSTALPPEHEQLPPPRIEEVSPGIYAYVQLDGSWFLNNAGCIVGSRSAVVIDTTGTEKRARAFHAAVREVTDLPVSALINTHSHGDHTHGNFMFSPASAIIASERCRLEMLAAGHAAYALFPMVDFGECPLTPPTVTFDDRLRVYVDDLAVELLYLSPAHTTSDIVAWVPERKLLFSGDLIFNGGTPFALGGSVAGWLEALDRIEALGPETIVPGHGPVCGPEVIGEVRAYLEWITAEGRKGFERGIPPLELARSLDFGRFAEWHDRERIVPNLHRVYSELEGRPRGAPLDYVQMFREMLEFNGGRPLRCLA
ncbi:MBL fold metallo-hydrolase [Tepidiforma sp.]|uniref:MBL fold metallo-hydrolase n=1 Tax=Tepidiforma sp. TaxID=2682230 RepID=UPI002ADE55D0|nr:MBL fold metallo-hydrolase [Tepidiforma sp.]